MATATEARFTPEDLLEITERPTPDLVDGQFEERPVGFKSSQIAATIAYLLLGFAKTTLRGRVSGSEGGFRIFPDDPNKVRFPDVAFVREDRIPAGQEFPGFATVVPDLVVEVVSPNDNAARLIRKIFDYLSAGVAMIWVVDPATRSVQVIRSDRTSRLLGPSETVDGGEALPGFSCPVAAFFE